MKKEEVNNYSLNEYPSVYWKKFFERFSEIESLSVEKWETVHLIAYLCKKYEEHYSVKFSFKFNSTSPSKSYELYQMRKISQMLTSEIPILKEYIDWFFENKIILKKKRITSLAFFSDINIINEFKFKKLAMDKQQNIERSTRLPEKYLNIILQLNSGDLMIRTYGDLAWFFLSSYKSHQPIFDGLAKEGFDLNILKKVR